MRRVLILGLTSAALALSGCSGGGEEGSLDSSSKDGGETGEGEKFTAKDGEDYDACRDGSCEVEVRDSVTIPLDEKFDVTKFEVTVKGGKVTARMDLPGGYSRISIDGEGTANLQGFLISVPLSNDDIAVINVDHQG